jgi:hypothetical protein
MTTTPRPSPNNSLSFRLVNLTISFAYQSLKTNCIATCIANGAAARNSGAAVRTSPTITSLRATSTGSGKFPIIRLSVSSFFFIFILFFNRCRLFIHPALVTHNQMSLMACLEVVETTPTSQTTAIPVRLDLFLVIVVLTVIVVLKATQRDLLSIITIL